MISKEEYLEIYELLDKVSPTDGDCGLLCGSACCTGKNAAARGSADRCTDEMGAAGDADCTPCEDDELGIFLLPGEEALHEESWEWLSLERLPAGSYGFPESWKDGVCFATCLKPPHCDRALRPIQCRTFPLTPHITGDGELIMLYNDQDLPYECPLINENVPLNDVFLYATEEAWQRLIKDPLIYDLVKQMSEEREEMIREMTDVFYPE